MSQLSFLRRASTSLKYRSLRAIEYVGYRAAQLGWADDSDRAMREFGDRFSGRPALIVGNGPSLNLSDVERLAASGMKTFACNKIFRAFGLTTWRPDVYAAADILMFEEHAAEFDGLECVKLFPKEFSRAGLVHKPGTIFFRSLAHRGAFTRQGPRFSTQGLRGFYVGQSVVTLNVQAAAYAGCDPIYLIGVDGTHHVPEMRAPHDKYGAITFSESGEDHFIKDYHRPNERIAVPKPDVVRSEYAALAVFCKQNSIRVFNVSRKSEIVAFQKVSADDL